MFLPYTLTFLSPTTSLRPFLPHCGLSSRTLIIVIILSSSKKMTAPMTLFAITPVHLPTGYPAALPAALLPTFFCITDPLITYSRNFPSASLPFYFQSALPLRLSLLVSHLFSLAKHVLKLK